MLTKSNYLIGLQCPKLLWITKNDKERIPKPDKQALAKFKRGHIIGKLATTLFDDGITISDVNMKSNMRKTLEALKERKPIFEAGIIQDELFSRADILLPVGKDEWDIIEVKSGSRVKDLNIHDVAFQKYVYEKAGLKIRNCILMHLNSEYVRNGEIEPSELFIQTDITEKMEEYSSNIKENIEKMFKVINGEEPEFSVDDILTIEYDNICKDEFIDNLPEDNIFQMYRMFTKDKIKLYKEGIIKIKDIPESTKLNKKQQIQRRLAFEGETHIEKDEIKNFLNTLKYPIYYLDFETINPALPKFDGTKPYQQIPFQFSLHIQNEHKGELKHVSFLAEGISDPRQKFMQALKDNLGKEGSILVYNQSFEKSRMRESADYLPEFNDWYEENILPRIKDLWDPFKDFSYYNPKQKGSASIKALLPIFSKLKYSDLELGNGAMASLEYERVTYGEVEEAERLKVYKALEEYCKMDTFAEVEIVEGLMEILNS